MQWIAMVLPSFLSIYCIELISKKELNWLQFFKKLGTYILLTNLISIFISHYIFNKSLLYYQFIDSNTFFIKYTVLNIIVAVFLPLFFLVLKPYISISIEFREGLKGEKRKNGSENT